MMDIFNAYSGNTGINIRSKNAQRARKISMEYVVSVGFRSFESTMKTFK